MPRPISGWPNFGVLGGEAEVAGQGELAAAAEGEAVHGGDPRLGRRLDRAHHGLAELRPAPRLLGREVLHRGDVGAGHERLVAAAGEDDDTDAVVGGQLARRGEQASRSSRRSAR